MTAALREVIILTVGMAWNSAYEIYIHMAAPGTGA